MTKSSQTKRIERKAYCVRFMSSSCYKIVLNARSEKHAITLAKQRWFHGSTDAFIPYAGDTDAWDAELELNQVDEAASQAALDRNHTKRTSRSD